MQHVASLVPIVRKRRAQDEAEDEKKEVELPPRKVAHLLQIMHAIDTRGHPITASRLTMKREKYMFPRNRQQRLGLFYPAGTIEHEMASYNQVHMELPPFFCIYIATVMDTLIEFVMLNLLDDRVSMIQKGREDIRQRRADIEKRAQKKRNNGKSEESVQAYIKRMNAQLDQHCLYASDTLILEEMATSAIWDTIGEMFDSMDSLVQIADGIDRTMHRMCGVQQDKVCNYISRQRTAINNRIRSVSKLDPEKNLILKLPSRLARGLNQL